ncbi:hypothetical protein RUND412_001440 [Rhizina undulata]
MSSSEENLTRWIRTQAFRLGVNRRQGFIGKKNVRKLIMDSVPPHILNMGYTVEMVGGRVSRLLADGLTGELIMESQRQRLKPHSGASESSPGGFNPTPTSTPTRRPPSSTGTPVSVPARQQSVRQEVVTPSTHTPAPAPRPLQTTSNIPQSVRAPPSAPTPVRAPALIFTPTRPPTSIPSTVPPVPTAFQNNLGLSSVLPERNVLPSRTAETVGLGSAETSSEESEQESSEDSEDEESEDDNAMQALCKKIIRAESPTTEDQGVVIKEALSESSGLGSRLKTGISLPNGADKQPVQGSASAPKMENHTPPAGSVLGRDSADPANEHAWVRGRDSIRSVSRSPSISPIPANRVRRPSPPPSPIPNIIHTVLSRSLPNIPLSPSNADTTSSSSLPYHLQHRILTRLQSILECTCYEHVQRWHPAVLIRHSWSCPEAAELTVWLKLIARESGPNPAAYGITEPEVFTFLVGELRELRNIAVRRIPVNGWTLLYLVVKTYLLAEVLGNKERLEKIGKILETVHAGMEEIRRRKFDVREDLQERLRRFEEERLELERRIQRAKDESEEAELSIQQEIESSLLVELDRLQSPQSASQPQSADAILFAVAKATLDANTSTLAVNGKQKAREPSREPSLERTLKRTLEPSPFPKPQAVSSPSTPSPKLALATSSQHTTPPQSTLLSSTEPLYPSVLERLKRKDTAGPANVDTRSIFSVRSVDEKFRPPTISSPKTVAATVNLDLEVGQLAGMFVGGGRNPFEIPTGTEAGHTT